MPALDLTLRQRLARRLSAPLAGLAMLTAPIAAELAEAPSAHADAGLEYTVDGTEIGVYARNSPRQDDTERITGHGAYDGDTVALVCGVTTGDPVGPYANRTWHYVRDLDRPRVGSFWINDHWVQSPNRANELAPGEPQCDEDKPAPVALPSTPDASKFVGGCKSNVAASLLRSSQDGIEGWRWSQAWAQEWGNESSDTICVGGTFGEPDKVKRRQFVGTVEAKVPDLEPTGCSDAYLVEIWGDGFYKKTNCIEPTQWNINKWLSNGTYVCAARSSAYDTGAYKSDAEAAKAVRSGRISLGADDPYREIACIAIKA